MNKLIEITCKEIDCVQYKSVNSRSNLEADRVLVGCTVDNGKTYITIGDPSDTIFIEAKELFGLILNFEEFGKIFEEMLDELEGGESYEN